MKFEQIKSFVAMDIGDDWKTEETPLLLTPLRGSVSTVEGNFLNVSFHESKLILTIQLPENLARIPPSITRIRCNYGNLVLVPEIEKKKKPRARPAVNKRPRRKQGTGECFNSQITFYVRGQHIRRRPTEPDRYSATAKPVGDDQERVEKIYKIKVFRTGRFQIPGAITETMEDVSQPLGDLCNYLMTFFPEIDLSELSTVMRNFKCRLSTKATIDLEELQTHLASSIGRLLNTSLDDICSYLAENRADYKGIVEYLRESDSPKNLLINPETLQIFIRHLKVRKTHLRINMYLESIYCRFGAHLPEATIAALRAKRLANKFARLDDLMKRVKENQCAGVNYDPEKYRGLIIKIKTPIAGKPDKQTTIKVFNSGKVNIDGANNREEAENIYRWFNWVLYSTRARVLYHEDQISSSDSEFSYSE